MGEAFYQSLESGLKDGVQNGVGADILHDASIPAVQHHEPFKEYLLNKVARIVFRVSTGTG